MSVEEYSKYLFDIKNMTKEELQEHIIAYYKTAMINDEIKERLRQEIELRDMKIKQLEEENAMLRMFIGGRGRE